ncbi:MAG: hypothetical protein ACR2PH_04385 [Desulfobulbia bacterium]
MMNTHEKIVAFTIWRIRVGGQKNRSMELLRFVSENHMANLFGNSSIINKNIIKNDIRQSLVAVSDTGIMPAIVSTVVVFDEGN